MVFTELDLKTLKLECGYDEVVIYSSNKNNSYKEVVKWISDEWEEDPSIMVSIINAVNLFHTNKKELISLFNHQVDIEKKYKIKLTKKSMSMINHLQNKVYFWYENVDDNEKRKLLSSLIKKFEKSSFDCPQDFMEHENYWCDADIIKIASFTNNNAWEKIFSNKKPAYNDTSSLKDFEEHLYSIGDVEDDFEPFKSLDEVSYIRIEKP